MAVLTPLSDDDGRLLVGSYDVGELRGLAGVAAGSVNSNFALDVAGRRLFLRLYEERDFEGAAQEAAMLERLAAAGVPTPAPLRRLDGGLVSSIAGKPAALFPWRDGTMRCQGSVTPIDTRRVGRALAEVHLAGVRERCGSARFRYEDLLVRLDVVAGSGNAEFAALASMLREELRRVHAAREPNLPGAMTARGPVSRQRAVGRARPDRGPPRLRERVRRNVRLRPDGDRPLVVRRAGARSGSRLGPVRRAMTACVR
jgi:Ser/Thr protein kinase RdoA (MazF antagonist)